MTVPYAQHGLGPRAARPRPPIAGCMLTLGLAALALLVAPGCPGPAVSPTSTGASLSGDAYAADPRGTTSLAANAASLPAASVVATAAISGDAGPDGSLFGVQLDDGSTAYALGTAAGGTDQSFTITDVVLLDANGNLVLHQGLMDSGTVVTFATGDAVTLTERADGVVEFKMTLYATVPPSELVGSYDSATGYVDFFAAESSTSYVLNTAYGETSAASAALWRPPTEADKAAARANLSDLSCETIGNGLTSAITLACDIRSLLTRKLPELAINAMGVGAQRAFETFKDPDHPLTVEVAAYAKWAVTIICEGLKAGIGIANVFTSLNPFDLACFILNTVDEGIQAGSGETLADKICDLITGDDEADDTSEDAGDDDSVGGTSTGDGPWQIDKIEMEEPGSSGAVETRVYWSGPADVPPGMDFFVEPLVIPGLGDAGCTTRDDQTDGGVYWGISHSDPFAYPFYTMYLDACGCGGGAFSYRISLVERVAGDFEYSSMVISGTCPDE
jgi:hypothetical protein